MAAFDIERTGVTFIAARCVPSDMTLNQVIALLFAVLMVTSMIAWGAATFI